MFDQAQLRKGTLEGCILKIIDREPTYGYAIATTLRDCGFADLTEGTLYPLLLRLERKGLIARTRDDADCRQKTVELTQRGLNSLEQRYRRLTAFLAEGFRSLGAHDAQEFLRLYERLFAIFDELSEHTEKKGV